MTTIFSSNFETGSFTGVWSGNYDQGGTSQVQNSIVKSGSYAAEFILTQNDGYGYADAYKNLGSTYTTANYRLYVRFDTLPTSGQGVLLGFLTNSSNNAILGIGLRYSSGAKWFVGYLKDGSYTLLYSSVNTPQTNTWYCVELKVIVDSSSGTVEAWINGTKDNSLSDTSGFNNTAWGSSLSKVFTGQDSQTEATYPLTVYVDDVIVADSYIGPLSGTASKLDYTSGAGQSITVGAISDVVTVQVQDSNGSPVTTGATVGLSTSSSGGSFYSDSGGNTQITSIVISSGQSDGNFYYKDTTAGTPTLTASSSGLTSATNQFTINQSGGQWTAGTVSNVGSGIKIETSTLMLDSTYSPTFAGLNVSSLVKMNGGNSSGPGLWFSNWGTSDNFGTSLGIGLSTQSLQQMILNSGGGFLFANAGTQTLSIDSSGLMRLKNSLYLAENYTIGIQGIYYNYFDNALNFQLGGGCGDWTIKNQSSTLFKVCNQTSPANSVQTKYNTIDDGSGNMTVTGTLTSKDTGKVLNVHWDPNAGGFMEELPLSIPYNHNTQTSYVPTNKQASIWMTTVNPLDRCSELQDPLLQTNFALRVEKDFQTFGFVGTSSDPQKQTGGGAVMMGQGFLGSGCPPWFALTGTLFYTDSYALQLFPNDHGTQYELPTPTGSRKKFYVTDLHIIMEDTPLWKWENGELVPDEPEWRFRGTTSTIGKYPTTYSATAPDGYLTGEWWLDKSDSANWKLKNNSSIMFEHIHSDEYDTMFFTRGNAINECSSLYLKDVTSVGTLYANQIKNLDGSSWTPGTSAITVSTSQEQLTLANSTTGHHTIFSQYTDDLFYVYNRSGTRWQLGGDTADYYFNIANYDWENLFYVYGTGAVTTKNNTLDDGSGNLVLRANNKALYGTSTSGSTKRLIELNDSNWVYINDDSSGETVIDTPLHVNGKIYVTDDIVPPNDTKSLGDSNHKWYYIYSHNTQFGDAIFANEWRLTETDHGVALKRPDGSIAQEWA
jgi:hypothetical protein